MQFVLLSCLASVALASMLIGQEDIKDVHREWMAKYNRFYHSEEEENHRFGVFMKNLEYILEHNMNQTMGRSTFTLEMNQHMDMTFDEFASSKLSFRHAHASRHAGRGHAGTHHKPAMRGDLPDTVDWREKGAVTAVKNQQQCGSCWSFSTTGAVEGAHYLATGKLVSLSEEQLINCIEGGKYDCKTGGDMEIGFQYVIDNGGLVSESTFPYNVKDHEKCKFKKNYNHYVAKISSYKTVATNDEDALKSAVAITPVSVAIDASHQSFQFYSSGVYDEPGCCQNCLGNQLNHGVLVVGYGTEDGKDYWLVKNSWGETWGDQGYIKMVRNKKGACGVPTHASYPIA